MVAVSVLILYVSFFIFPKYDLDRDLKYIGLMVVGFFTIPFVVMFYIRNFLMNKLILEYKNDIREIIDRTVLSGDIEESLYIKLLRKNKLENFSLAKPIIETPFLKDCEHLIKFKNNTIVINNNLYDISKITYYKIVVVRFKSTIYHHNLFFIIEGNNYNEIIDTIDKDKVAKISDMFYKSILEFNHNFNFPSIRISKKLNKHLNETNIS